MANKKPVTIIKYRMKVLGVDLNKHISEVTNSWEDTTLGFNFIPKDWEAFAWALRNSGQFCIDTAIAHKFQKKGSLSWREVNKDSSMHVLLCKGKPYTKYKKVVTYYQLHIDSVSVVAGTDRAGKCYYALDQLAKHNIVDKWKLPFVVPDREGLRLGIRF